MLRKRFKGEEILKIQFKITDFGNKMDVLLSNSRFWKSDQIEAKTTFNTESREICNFFSSFLSFSLVDLLQLLYQYHWTVNYLFIEKKIFAGKTLNMMILSSLASSPRNVLSIPAFYLKNFFWPETPFKWIFFKKNFPTENLKILQKVAPIGF